MLNAKLIDDLDNVIVATCEIKKGEEVRYLTGTEQEECLSVKDSIPLFHKIARSELQKGKDIIKYGHCIGIAATDIKKGEHVHTHNVKNKKES